MSAVNKVILIGNLGADPELRVTESDNSVTELRVATNEKWTDRQGNKQERTEWHRVIVWGKTAENCAEFLGKGSQVYIEGKLQTRKWEDKDGVERYTTEITARDVQFLSGGAGGSGNGAGAREEEPDRGRRSGGSGRGGGRGQRAGGPAGRGGRSSTRAVPQGDWGDQSEPCDDDVPF